MMDIKSNGIKENELKSNKFDYTVSFLKSLAGFIPYVGTSVGEIIGICVPNQRMDRFEQFLKQLSQRIYTLEEKQQQWLNDLRLDKTNLLLFELGCKYSLETNSDTLHGCYANIVFNSVLDKNSEQIKYEKILRTISELAEEEVIWLVRFSLIGPDFSESKFYKTFEKILEPHTRVVSASQEDKDFNAFRDQYIINLIQKGLLYKRVYRLDGNDSKPILKDIA